MSYLQKCIIDRKKFESQLETKNSGEWRAWRNHFEPLILVLGHLAWSSFLSSKQQFPREKRPLFKILVPDYLMSDFFQKKNSQKMKTLAVRGIHLPRNTLISCPSKTYLSKRWIAVFKELSLKNSTSHRPPSDNCTKSTSPARSKSDLK